MKVIITGSTGMVGKGVLLECLDSPAIREVLIVNRTKLLLEHIKMKQVIVEDFYNLADVYENLKGYDACFFCLGTTSVGKSEDVFSKVTYELTTIFARAFKAQNPDSVFCYVSGQGTDSTEKGRVMWARVKGKTENAILNMGFKDAYMFRPGFIQPLRGIKTKTGWYALMYKVFGFLYKILKRFPSTATNTTNMGLAMIHALTKGSEKKILGNKEINELANDEKES